MKSVNDLFVDLYLSFIPKTKYAGLLRRIIAFLIDFIILSIVNGILISFFSLETTIQSKAFEPILLISHPYSLLVNLMYFSILESLPNYQSTIGKRVMKMKVTDIGGTRIKFWRAFGRCFGKIITCFTLGIGYFIIPFTKRKQALHDFAFGTLVINEYSVD